MTDVIVIFHFGLILPFYTPTHPPPPFLTKKSIFRTECNSLWDEKKSKKENCKLNSLIQTLVCRSNIYYSKIYQEKIEKTIAQLSIWKCGLGILDKDTQLNSLELLWISRLLNPTNALWKGLMLYWLNLRNNYNQGLCLFRQKQILRSSRHKNKIMKIFLEI